MALRDCPRSDLHTAWLAFIFVVGLILVVWVGYLAQKRARNGFRSDFCRFGVWSKTRSTAARPEGDPTQFLLFVWPLTMSRWAPAWLWRGLPGCLRLSNNCATGGYTRDFENPGGFSGKWPGADLCVLQRVGLDRSKGLLTAAFCTREKHRAS